MSIPAPITTHAASRQHLTTVLHLMHELATAYPHLQRQPDLLYAASLVVKQAVSTAPVCPSNRAALVQSNTYTASAITANMLACRNAFTIMRQQLIQAYIPEVIADAIFKHYDHMYRNPWSRLRTAVNKAAPVSANTYGTASADNCVFEDDQFVIVSYNKSYPVATIAQHMIGLWNRYWSKVKTNHVHTLAKDWFFAISDRNVLRLMYSTSLIDVATIHLKEE